MQDRRLIYVMNDAVEVNLSYMPYIIGGGLFVPSPESFTLGERVIVGMTLPNSQAIITIEGSVVWITPHNALHHALPGIGIQLIGTKAQSIREKIEASLTKNMEVGGYTYGITKF